MNALTANSVLPIVSALPEEEKHALLLSLQKMLKPRPAPKRKKDIYDKIGDKYRPENIELLVHEIMHP